MLLIGNIYLVTSQHSNRNSVAKELVTVTKCEAHAACELTP